MRVSFTEKRPAKTHRCGCDIKAYLLPCKVVLPVGPSKPATLIQTESHVTAHTGSSRELRSTSYKNTQVQACLICLMFQIWGKFNQQFLCWKCWWDDLFRDEVDNKHTTTWLVQVYTRQTHTHTGPAPRLITNQAKQETASRPQIPRGPQNTRLSLCGYCFVFVLFCFALFCYVLFCFALYFEGTVHFYWLQVH